MLVIGRRHLEVILDEYVGHYNQHRPHRGLDLGVPLPSNRTTGDPPPLRVRRRDVLGGLIHEYDAVAD